MDIIRLHFECAIPEYISKNPRYFVRIEGSRPLYEDGPRFSDLLITTLCYLPDLYNSHKLSIKVSYRNISPVDQGHARRLLQQYAKAEGVEVTEMKL